MCGIAGSAHPFPSPPDDGSAALESLRRRGPDGSDRQAWSGENGTWQLLHTRLAINDLSAAGDQPISDEDGSLVMVFNGEIYNSPELRRRCEAAGHRFRSTMDGEVILHLWEMEGAASLARLNGIFALAIADTRTGEVVLARDPLGVKPLFYSLDERGSLWFASELTSLRAAGAPMGGEDLVGLAQFLTFLWVPAPRTPFQGAASLPPGTMLQWSSTGSKTLRYVEPLVPSEEPLRLTADAARVEAGERFAAAAQRQLLSDVPIGLMASGGIDSGLLWWATHETLDHAYTIDWTGGRTAEGLGDETAGVTDLQQRFGTRVTRIPGHDVDMEMLPISGDLFADPAYELTRMIARRAREDGLKVLLSGQGGDELFGGYRRHVAAPLVGRLRLGRLGGLAADAMTAKQLPGLGGVRGEYLARLARASSASDGFAAYMQLSTYSSATDRARILDCDVHEVSDEVVWEQHRTVFEALPPSLSFLRKAMTVDLQVYLPGLGLAYVDRAGMEFGVEIRVPWLDLDYVRWSLTLPDGLLVRGRQGKWLTRDVAAQVISPQMAARPKRGFGAPAASVPSAPTAVGERGFRQSRYLNLATSVLGRHRNAVALSA